MESAVGVVGFEFRCCAVELWSPLSIDAFNPVELAVWPFCPALLVGSGTSCVGWCPGRPFMVWKVVYCTVVGGIAGFVGGTTGAGWPVATA